MAVVPSEPHSSSSARIPRSDEIRVHRQARRLALLRVKLAGRQVFMPDDCRKRLGIIRHRRDVLEVSRDRMVRMHESTPTGPDQDPPRAAPVSAPEAYSSPCGESSGPAARRIARPFRVTVPGPCARRPRGSRQTRAANRGRPPGTVCPPEPPRKRPRPAPIRSSSAIASANAPTPGNTTFDAFRTRSGSELI